MSLFSRIATFMTNTPSPNDLNGEFNNIENVLNNLDSGNLRWNVVDATTLKIAGVPVTASKFVQYVTATNTGGTTTNSTSFQNTSLTVTITPTSASNKVLILAVGELGTSGNNKEVQATIFKGGSNILGANGMGYVYTNTGTTISSLNVSVPIIYLDSPASTSALVYSIAIRSVEGTTNADWGGANSMTQFIMAVELA